jgi:hypothetical protein
MQTSISARELTRRKATGMTREQTAEATQIARLHLRLRSWSCEVVQDQAVIRRLRQIHEEWQRIGAVMTSEGMSVYRPDQDPGVPNRAQDDAQHPHPSDRPARQDRVVPQSRRGSADLQERETPEPLSTGFGQLQELDRTTIAQLIDLLERARADAPPARFSA